MWKYKRSQLDKNNPWGEGMVRIIIMEELSFQISDYMTNP